MIFAAYPFNRTVLSTAVTVPGAELTFFIIKATLIVYPIMASKDNCTTQPSIPNAPPPSNNKQTHSQHYTQTFMDHVKKARLESIAPPPAPFDPLAEPPKSERLFWYPRHYHTLSPVYSLYFPPYSSIPDDDFICSNCHNSEHTKLYTDTRNERALDDFPAVNRELRIVHREWRIYCVFCTVFLPFKTKLV